MENPIRETRILETPMKKQEVIVNTYLTGREQRQLRDIMLKDFTFSGGEKAEAQGFKGSLVEKVEDLTIDLLVVSVGGVKGSEKTNALLDMQAEDYNFIMTELDKIKGTGDDSDEKKTK